MSTEKPKTAVKANPPVQDAPAASVKKGTLILLLVIFLSLLWYLTSDRFTPYTQQARIQGFVVGVAPKVGGVVIDVFVRDDEMVKANQALFAIDPSQYAIALERAQSDLEDTQNQVGAAAAGVDSARANLKAAQANAVRAKQDAARQQRLHKQDAGTISVRRLEMSEASREQAIAKVAAAEAEVQRAIEQMSGEEVDNAKLKTAQTAVEKAALDLDNTIVRATSDGIITDLRANAGQYASAGAPIMTLISIQDVWIRAEFTENNLGHMKVGTPVEMVIDSLPGNVYSGKVRSIGIGVAAGQPPPPGTLPTISNNRDWLRQSQRFAVNISLPLESIKEIKDAIRVGGQVEVIAYTEEAGLLKLIGKLYIRVMSWFSYAY